ncbi:MAG: redoxin family protein [Phycisphaerales bacterium]
MRPSNRLGHDSVLNLLARRFPTAAAVALAAGIAGLAHAAGELTVGSPAPAPEISNFVRGDAPKFFEPGKVYVVEFWATWCGPCRQSMPHLTETSKKYKDKGVIIVGVSDEKLETVTKFLDQPEWQEKAQYILATDPDRSTHKAYMEAAAQGGIPTAFIVKDGTVQWIGHPMTMDEPLAQIVDGKWDLQAFKKTFEPKQAQARRAMEMRSAMAAASKSGDYSAVIARLQKDVQESEAGESRTMAQMTLFRLLATAANHPDDAWKVAREIAAANKSDAETLNEVAWFILDNKGVKERNYPLALEIAKTAADAPNGSNGAVLDTLARAYWENGDKAKAISTQKSAIEKSDVAQAKELQSTLERYEKNEAPKPNSAAPKQPTTKTAFHPAQDAPKAPPAAPKGAGNVPVTPVAPPASTLGPEAQKAFPEVKEEGFVSVEEMVTFLPTLATDPNAAGRMVRAMHAGTDDSKLTLRVTSAIMEDMQPMVAALVEKYKRPIGGMFNIPAGAEGGTFKASAVEAATALVSYTDKDGKNVGQGVPLIKVNEKWFFDFDKATGGGRNGQQMAMMANMLGGSMRSAVKSAAETTATDVRAGKFPTAEEAQMAFAQAMNQAIMKVMDPTAPPANAVKNGAPAGGAPKTAPPSAPITTTPRTTTGTGTTAPATTPSSPK